MIVRNSLAPKGIDLGPATPRMDDEDRFDGGTFVAAIEDESESPEQIRRRQQWREAQQRRRERLATGS